MIGAFFMVYIAVWVYQAGIRSGSKHIVKWTVFLTALFFMVQLSWNLIDAFFIFSESRPVFAPTIAGFVVVALIRTKLVMGEKLTIANIFSHMDVFTSKVNAKSDTAEF